MISKCKVFVLVLVILTITVGQRSAIASLEKGLQIFEEKCLKCHTVGEGSKVGPDPSGVTERREKVWFTNWIADPEKVIASGDPVAKRFTLPRRV